MPTKPYVETNTAKYQPVRCWRCGSPYRAYEFSDTWNMRIDGKIHAVPVFAVPCMRCDDCNIAVTDGGSDEMIQWAYNKYLNAHGLNTPRLRVKRWFRRQYLRVCDRWNWYVLRFDKWRGKYD